MHFAIFLLYSYAVLCYEFQESSLTDLMDTEANIYKQIQSLDSEMQTLVYENYNKFISATDTIRKMKVDFKKMEDEMECLAENMTHITAFSATVSDTLQVSVAADSNVIHIH